MSRYEDVLVDADLTLPAFAARIAEITGRVPERITMQDGEETYRVDLGDTSSGLLAVADLEDEPHAAFSAYRFLIEVQTVRDGRRDFGHAERVAHELYDRLATDTDWPLMLALHDGDEIAAIRGVPAAA